MSIYKFYVYAYLRVDNTPYYIGKGCGPRAYLNHKHIHVPKEKYKIIFLECNLSNVGACAIERRMIRWYGRKGIDENGILHNSTLGGDGGSGPMSEETKQKHRCPRKINIK